MNVVQKYGGTSLDSIEKIRAVAKHIASFRKPEDGIVIVASAMGKTTDELISLAKEVGEEVPKRELDALLSTGEQKTVALLAIALHNLGVPAVSMTGFQSGLIIFSRRQHFFHLLKACFRIGNILVRWCAVYKARSSELLHGKPR